MRYLVLGSITMYRVWTIMKNGIKQGGEAWAEKYRENQVVAFVLASCTFIQFEGVGFVIYFGTSALMDNYTIYFVNNTKFCECTTQVALYSMAVITFLPCCQLAYRLQSSWYDNGSWWGFRSSFIVLMVASAMATFVARLYLVYRFGWIALVDHMLDGTSYKVAIAALVPPVVDALQTLMLIAASSEKTPLKTEVSAVQEPLLHSECKKPEPCTTRLPIKGDKVMKINCERTTMGEWVLEPGEQAIVESVDKDGDFRLCNAKGMISRLALRREYRYVGQAFGDVRKIAVMAAAYPGTMQDAAEIGGKMRDPDV
jgi:hypothetical protein